MSTLTRSTADDTAPFGLTANGRPVPGGFTGTVAEFLQWLEGHLAYGGVGIGEAEPDRFGSRTIRRVELVTAGYSDDEDLLERVFKSLFSTCFWESTHRGGLNVYTVPSELFASTEARTWLEPPTEVFEEIYRVRELIVHTPQGDEWSIELPAGARLSFSEPDRDVCAPAGVLTIDPIELDEQEDLLS